MSHFDNADGRGCRLGGDGAISGPPAPKNYALSGKIMLSAIVILFTVVLLVLCLHVYARWYLLRRTRLRRRSRRRIVFTAEHQANAAAIARGLDPEVLLSLPVFTYSAAKFAGESNESMECAVCLSEFQENDRGRRLPGCKHSFHIECIDMWFYSHATCPLCRSTVEPEPPLPVSGSVNLQIEPPALPELCDSCRLQDEGAAASSSFSSSSAAPSCSSSNSSSAHGAVCRIEVPPRSLEEEMGSPGAAQGFKSPASRMASLKKILSFDLRFYRGPCSFNEPDLERGESAEAAEEQTPRTPAAPLQQQR